MLKNVTNTSLKYFNMTQTLSIFQRVLTFHCLDRGRILNPKVLSAK